MQDTKKYVDKKDVDKKDIDKNGLNKSHTTAMSESLEDEFVSKTQLKKEAKSLLDFGRELIQLSESKLNQLPLNETTLKAVREFHKQHGNIAKKRHMAFIGKCLRSDSAEEAREFLREDKFKQLRNEVPASESANQTLSNLIEQGDAFIQELLTANPSVERQVIRQLVRNYKNAKTEAKRKSAQQKLNDYLLQFNIKD
ncbi:MAG: DUF615 domain-containing protein [Kangiellaceae bacterium]|nr:DUF615 domain-containing protein [Kangiellaceae bacterium]MCW8997119.1 DUF615 domain-containing protein [Kangiellaceae bacterium]MCW9015749.1 DUF615 domain-containing protein [Kangiellaceae bacterium]